MYVKTSKGKIYMPAKLEGLTEEEILTQRKVLFDYQCGNI